MRANVDVWVAAHPVVANLGNHLAGVDLVAYLYEWRLNVGYADDRPVVGLEANRRGSGFSHDSGNIGNGVDMDADYLALARRKNILIPAIPILIAESVGLETARESASIDFDQFLRDAI